MSLSRLYYLLIRALNINYLNIYRAVTTRTSKKFSLLYNRFIIIAVLMSCLSISAPSYKLSFSGGLIVLLNLRRTGGSGVGLALGGDEGVVVFPLLSGAASVKAWSRANISSNKSRSTWSCGTVVPPL